MSATRCSPPPSPVAASSTRPSRSSPPTTRGSRAAGRRSRRCASTTAGRSGSQQHLDRLAASAGRIGLEPPGRGRARAPRGARARAGGDARGRAPALLDAGPARREHRGVALVGPIPAWIEDARARGQRLVSLLHPRRSAPWLLPATKSTSYAVNIAAEAEAKARGADDAVFVDADGIVLEGPVTNVWWREGDVLLTPSLELGILAGETRAALLELARGAGTASSRRGVSRSSGCSRRTRSSPRRRSGR